METYENNNIDLAQFDEKFDSTEVEEREFEDVPDGKYQVNVDKVELTKAKSSGNTMLKWTLRIIAPKHTGRFLWRNSVIATDGNIKWLKQDLYTCGLELKKLSDLPANLEKLLNLKLDITKRTKGDNENIYINKRIEIADPAEAVPGVGTPF